MRATGKGAIATETRTHSVQSQGIVCVSRRFQSGVGEIRNPKLG
jgi:hypothetical protein